ncbi:hypothetical protein [Streptomyces yaizuensis]|uniref:Integral membrane protein n=1 Tax=Streptomyces yaizuensis TaxID=2989713 RepID=A0ABQ5NYV2_9ACTN|nr:hypothetical protein [Streptomyces sp. YSPA8]GLF95136.1 hypothetical protein SYYSPA8_12585 [Streptomyces sp. YSPA8]
MGLLDLGTVATAKGGTITDGPGSGWYTAAGWIGGIWVLLLGAFVVGRVKSREPLPPVELLVILTHMPAAAVISVLVLFQVDESGRHTDSAWLFIAVGLAVPALLWLLNRAGLRGEARARAPRR